MENKFIEGSLPPEDGTYYINNTRRLLTFQDGQWFKPVLRKGAPTGYIENTPLKVTVKSYKKYYSLIFKY